MSNLKAFSRARAEADDQEIERLEAEQANEEEIRKVENTPAPENPQEANWAKRYADLRRLDQKKEAEWRKREEELKAKLEEARKSSPGSVPVTKEELEDYIERYPKVGALINKIVQDELSLRLAGNEERLAKIDELEASASEEAARKALAKRVPEYFGDSDELLPDGSPAIVNRAEFYDWLDSKKDDPIDGWVYDAINKSLNVGQAAAAINQWMRETNFSVEEKPKRKSKKSDADAASSVRTTGKPTIGESSKGDYDFTESQIGRMNFREFEKFESAIEEARLAGRILYDISA
jgi:hypothetical protein